jgi:UDP-N-acetylmuramoyl-L-alanyl-D-glutamate--2,6-diaminopimelate ligase
MGGRVPFVATPNPRRALAFSAAKFYPRQPATIAAVTGTSGKTSVAAFTRQIWLRLGYPSASIGTIGVVAPSRMVYGSVTTPDPIALHRELDQLVGEGVTHLALEASSHGLDQYRLDGVRVRAAGFTNLSRDHMDYHPTVAHYLDTKLRLFRELVAPDGVAVISADHDCSGTVIEAASARNVRVMRVGRRGDGTHSGIRLADAGKRPLMGEIAADNADVVIVTDDNPRSENPAVIRAAILAAATGAREIGDRAEAIRIAIAGLQPGDALLIAGKGHETGQIVGDRVLPFSDHEAAIAALTSRVV